MYTSFLCEKALILHVDFVCSQPEGGYAVTLC